VLLRSPQAEQQFLEGTRISAQGAFGIKKMRKLWLPIPSLKIQQEMTLLFKSYQKRIDILKQTQTKSSAELDALLPSILDKAFKGEL
jgi:type I restriction enzyme S subunit